MTVPEVTLFPFEVSCPPTSTTPSHWLLPLIVRSPSTTSMPRPFHGSVKSPFQPGDVCLLWT